MISKSLGEIHKRFESKQCVKYDICMYLIQFCMKLKQSEFSGRYLLYKNLNKYNFTFISKKITIIITYLNCSNKIPPKARRTLFKRLEANNDD